MFKFKENQPGLNAISHIQAEFLYIKTTSSHHLLYKIKQKENLLFLVLGLFNIQLYVSA